MFNMIHIHKQNIDLNFCELEFEVEIRHIVFATKTTVDSERSLKQNEIRTGQYYANAIEFRNSDFRVKSITQNYLAIGLKGTK